MTDPDVSETVTDSVGSVPVLARPRHGAGCQEGLDGLLAIAAMVAGKRGR